MRQLLVLGAVIAAQVWWLPQSWGDEGQPRRSKDVAGPAGSGVVVGDLDNDGRLDLLGPAVPAKRRLVTLDDGTKLPLDPAGLLVTQTLKGRFIVDWNSPLTVAESGGPIPIKLRNVPLTLNLRDIGGGKQGVVRLRGRRGRPRSNCGCGLPLARRQCGWKSRPCAPIRRARRKPETNRCGCGCALTPRRSRSCPWREPSPSESWAAPTDNRRLPRPARRYI